MSHITEQTPEASCMEALQKAGSVFGYPFMLKSPTNQIFPVFPDELIHQLEDKYSCSYWDWGRTDPQHSITRIVTSWATDPKSVDAFLSDLKQLTK